MTKAKITTAARAAQQAALAAAFNATPSLDPKILARDLKPGDLVLVKWVDAAPTLCIMQNWAETKHRLKSFCESKAPQGDLCLWVAQLGNSHIVIVDCTHDQIIGRYGPALALIKRGFDADAFIPPAYVGIEA